MKYYLDTEFDESPCTIQLISIGIAAEDGREFYAVSKDFNRNHVNNWVRENVLPNIGEVEPIGRADIAQRVIGFVGDNPEFWGYYADYDWVVFCWLFGPMVSLPRGFPKYCRDLKQQLDLAGNPHVPIIKCNEHNALSDARWIKQAHEWLAGGA